MCKGHLAAVTSRRVNSQAKAKSSHLLETSSVRSSIAIYCYRNNAKFPPSRLNLQGGKLHNSFPRAESLDPSFLIAASQIQQCIFCSSCSGESLLHALTCIHATQQLAGLPHLADLRATPHQTISRTDRMNLPNLQNGLSELPHHQSCGTVPQSLQRLSCTCYVVMPQIDRHRKNLLPQPPPRGKLPFPQRNFIPRELELANFFLILVQLRHTLSSAVLAGYTCVVAR